MLTEPNKNPNCNKTDTPTAYVETPVPAYDVLSAPAADASIEDSVIHGNIKPSVRPDGEGGRMLYVP